MEYNCMMCGERVIYNAEVEDGMCVVCEDCYNLIKETTEEEEEEV